MQPNPTREAIARIVDPDARSWAQDCSYTAVERWNVAVAKADAILALPRTFTDEEVETAIAAFRTAMFTDPPTSVDACVRAALNALASTSGTDDRVGDDVKPFDPASAPLMPDFGQIATAAAEREPEPDPDEQIAPFMGRRAKMDDDTAAMTEAHRAAAPICQHIGVIGVGNAGQSLKWTCQSCGHSWEGSAVWDGNGRFIPPEAAPRIILQPSEPPTPSTPDDFGALRMLVVDWVDETDRAQADALVSRLQARVAKMEEGLRSIAANTCCDTCREAALVARDALAGV